MIDFLDGVLQDRGTTATTESFRYTAGRPGPEIWADAPWRVEPPGPGQNPGEQEIPFTFIMRDMEGVLDEITVYESPGDGLPLHTIQGPGMISSRFWVARTAIRRDRFKAAGPRLLVRVVFQGDWETPAGSQSEWEQWLSIAMASQPLPLRDSSRWYYGDTHYHSSYTNDIKEFGGPVSDTRAAAECIGLDWLVLTDHSVDLDDRNPYFENRQSDTRWDEMGKDVEEASSQGSVRLLRGEEVTVIGQSGFPGESNTLHLLVFGAESGKLIPGAWARSQLLATVAKNLPPGSRQYYEYLFGTIHRLEEVLTGKDKNNQVVEALRGRSIEEQKALAFAAHPSSMAQGIGGTWEDKDLAQAIHGMESWNARAWFRSATEERPFDNWKKTSRKERTKPLKEVEGWDEMLRWKLEHAPDPRFVLLAGSDAHGSFNYSVGYGMDWDGIRADDNSLGKVRTLLYLPDKVLREMPSEDEVTTAIRTGSCVVTDGPVLNFTIGFNGGEPATLGQIVRAEGDGAFELKLQGHSTGEFGPVQHVDLVYYFQGMQAGKKKRVRLGDPPRGPLGTLLSRIRAFVKATPWETEVPSGSGYIRLQTETQVDTPDGKQTYRCFTNPIWIESAGAGLRQLRVSCSD